MLKAILGNETKEKILLYIYVFKKAYIREISNVFEIPVRSVANQLDRLEEGAVLVSNLEGKIRIYQFNPNYVFLKELLALLEKEYSILPLKEKEKYFIKRKRPRKREKP
ncbi:MAG: hypothetical protein PHV06_00215 [bacterium]|nr:hypothetical protein [bacterium]